ncbi:hypothetical protein FQR65_LT03800 [Abscondita terminalis]|nr:hypothetical protein FQR65_LT03800 [Abscondita terminalis]
MSSLDGACNLKRNSSSLFDCQIHKTVVDEARDELRELPDMVEISKNATSHLTENWAMRKQEGILCARPDSVVREDEDGGESNPYTHFCERIVRTEETDKLWQNIKSKRVRFYMEDLGPELVDPMFPTTTVVARMMEVNRAA